ncbi:MAG TPA: 4a-hydroxytetrahydrobiopterin dehydratase [Candidatus Binatia bacterium]|jgi:4a-hydroxytetrahydrobiopterin dehydratase
MTRLSQKRCTPCHDGMPSLTIPEATALVRDLDGWQLEPGPRLVKQWKLPDFASALALVNRIGAIAEAENHHPDITLGWGKVAVELWTHAARGLTENDFIVAAKIDEAQAGHH